MTSRSPTSAAVRLARQAAALAGAFAASAVLAQEVTIDRDSALRAEPAMNAATVASVRKGLKGEQLAKQGFWVQVKTAEGTGWVFMFNVRYPADPASGGGARTAATPRTGVTATIGVRGLDEADLQRATFSAPEMQRLDGFAASKDAAAQHAQANGLAAASIKYLGE